DLKFLDSMLKLDPDLLPCDLAVICKLPCEQIFLYRRQLLPDDEILENRYQLEVTECNIEPTDFCKQRMPPVESRTERSSLRMSPCVHPGPCSAHTHCECANLKTFCERNCRCPSSCPRRWTGCNDSCGKTRIKKCSGSQCDCRRLGRECDPELCTKCDAR
ncbi:hypothetical protein B0H13DRAFT_1519626, partial [Mycena leptocephala]